MTSKREQNAELKKLMDWHLHQAAECRTADEIGERDFHTWAATLISTVRQTR
jgi:hypothetical protein